MREIKFRAWDMAEKEMINWRNIKTNLWLYLSGEYTEKHPLMQFTGLKDSKGKEIYEGDIVQFKEHGLQIREVYFDRGEFQCSKTGVRHLSNVNILSKVIGNIYENPEFIMGAI
jgi:hypothetical protein